MSHFMQDAAVSVLFMDSGGAVGFDLSKVRRIICLEPVHELDAWNQLLSRARRMGADPNIDIEVLTLIYADSDEAAILDQRCGHASQRILKRRRRDLPPSAAPDEEAGSSCQKMLRTEDGDSVRSQSSTQDQLKDAQTQDCGAMSVEDVIASWDITAYVPPAPESELSGTTTITNPEPHQLPSGTHNRKGRRVGFGP